ncbi:Thyrotropin subunit beta [Trichinella spiralis]|uniref:Thyrotropin subunit beta n=1 Tax=Trichinella spiralis TaxID=6334 RepID=A0ABR3K6N3_TRISP
MQINFSTGTSSYFYPAPLPPNHSQASVERYPMCPCGIHLQRSVIDNQGRSCHQQIATVACRGLCESYESSDYRIPESVVFKYSKCDYEQFERRVTLLSNCDADIDPGVQLYHYDEAISCSCKSCMSFDDDCMLKFTRNLHFKSSGVVI